MNNSIVSLYKYLYSMGQNDTRFKDANIQVACMRNLIGIYQKVHQSGMIVGPIDFNRIEIKLDDGSIRLPQRIKKEDLLNAVDLIKFAPPEINTGLHEWDIYSDLYCLAILIFVIRYSGFPFDGVLVNVSPIVSIDDAHRVYDKPIFIFDVLDTSNCVCSECNASTISTWNKEKNNDLKDLFIRAFADGIINNDVRVTCNQWLGALEMEVV